MRCSWEASELRTETQLTDALAREIIRNGIILPKTFQCEFLGVWPGDGRQRHLTEGAVVTKFETDYEPDAEALAKATTAESRSRSDGQVGFIESYLPYMLNTLVHRMLIGVDKRFAEYGLTMGSWRVLAALAENPSCGFARLAVLTGTHPPTLSRLLTIMIKQKLVRQRRSRTDARTVAINITPEGKALFESTLEWAYAAEDRLLQGLTEDEVRALKAALRVCTANLE